MAFATLWSHRLRSTLTIVGIVIGVTAIVGMTSLVRGLNDQIIGDIKDIGADHMFLRKWAGRIIVGDREFQRLEARPEITESDAAAIARLPSVSTHDIMLGTGPAPLRETLSHRGNKVSLPILGTTDRYAVVNAADVGNGRFFTATEVANRNRVAVIGPGVVEVLFPHVDPIGKSIRIGGLPYDVIGVFEEQSMLLWGQTKDNRVILPYTSLYRDFDPAPVMDLMLTIVPNPLFGQNRARDDVTFLLRSRHALRPGEENDFDIVTQSSFLELWDQVTGSVFLAMIVISSIALLVGGIGVMNIMLVSVTERTREIGIRKALGARKRDILWQFMIEATVLTGIGGIFGVLIGSALGAGVANLIHFPVSIPVWSFFAGVGFSAAIGIFFGVFPAHKAASLDPIEALRYE